MAHLVMICFIKISCITIRMNISDQINHRFVYGRVAFKISCTYNSNRASYQKAVDDHDISRRSMKILQLNDVPINNRDDQATIKIPLLSPIYHTYEISVFFFACRCWYL